MKTYLFTGLLGLIILSSFSSCRTSDHEPDLVFYNLALSFQDASGKDLVQGIELEHESGSVSVEQAQSGLVKSDLYTLKVVTSQPCEDVIASKSKNYIPDSPRLGMTKYNGYSFLTNDFGMDASYCPDEKVLTYKLKCPTVFGDEAEHELVTYWEVPKIQNNFAKAICNRIEFEGKVITPTIVPESYNYQAIVILESKAKE